MAHKREKETENPLTCTPSLSSSPSLSSNFPDPPPDPPISSRPTSAKSPERPDPARARPPPPVAASPKRREVNRCSGCRRKVGLTGFRCRCGELFCTEHRYSDRHDCSFDYKAAGREAIAKDNPVVRPAKLLKV